MKTMLNSVKTVVIIFQKRIVIIKKDNNKKEKKKKEKVKHKTKTKNKTKVKKEKTKVPKYKQSSDKPRSSVFTKILLLFFILLSIGLLVIASILGYNYYLENNIEVPNVTGYTYEEATAILDTASLSYEMKEQETTNQDEVLEIAFKVRGSREKLKELVHFLKERGYEYEQQ